MRDANLIDLSSYVPDVRWLWKWMPI